MTRQRLVLLSEKTQIFPYRLERSAFRDIDVEIDDVRIESRGEAIEALRDADVVMTGFSLDAELIEAMEKTRGICIFGHGFDKVDINAATDAGIIVTNAAHICNWEVANHAAAMILALNRNLVQYDRAMRSGVWDRPGGRPVGPLDGEVVGLIGLGAIGRSLAKRLQPFGLRVVAYDALAEDWPFREYGVERFNDLHDMLSISDYVSLQVPLNTQTYHLIGEAEFSAMKPSAMFVSCCRGGTVDEVALIAALNNGEIAKAGLDVFETEPCDPDHPLLKMDNFIASPHAGGESTVSGQWSGVAASGEAALILKGHWPRRVVNPEVRKNLRKATA